MAGRSWTEEELAFVKAKIETGRHPDQFLSELNERFGNNRSATGLKQKLRYLGVGYQNLWQGDRTGVDIDVPEQVRHDAEKARLKQQVQRLESLYKEATDQLNWQQEVVSLGQTAIESLPKVKQPTFPKPSKKQTVEQAVMLLSDIHFGEVVRSAEMRGFNEYNVSIANARLKAYVETTQDILANKLSGYHIEKLNLLMLGDMVSGTIHEELVEQTEGTIVDWSCNLAYIMAQMVRDLLMVVPSIDIECVFGNHGRTSKKPRYKSRYVNWDWIAYQFMAMFLASEIKAGRVRINIPVSFWTVKEIAGWNWLVMHGDNIKSWMGIPFYGIQRSISRLQELLATKREFFQYITLGHFHSLGSLDKMKGELVLNGSVIGANEYSMGAMYTISQARQAIMGVHPDHGITWRYAIDLQDRAIAGDLYACADLEERTLGHVLAGV